MKSNVKTISDDDIALIGTIISPDEVNHDPAEREMLELARNVSKITGVHLHTVKFPDGIITLLPGDPRDEQEWKRRVAMVYRKAAAFETGPIDFGAGK